MQFTSKHKEVELREGDDHKDFVHAFNGYAPAGDVEVDISDVVYTHYTRVEDLQELGEAETFKFWLESVFEKSFPFSEKMGISVEGKICLAR